MIRRWPTLPGPDLPTGGAIDLGMMIFALLMPKSREEAKPAERPRRQPPDPPRRPPRPARERPGDVRIHFVSVDYPPMHYELLCREVGIRVFGQRIHGKAEGGGGVRASFCVSAGQKRWAEEVLFVQGTAVPEYMDRLDPATARRWAERGPYTPAHKWQKGTAKPVGIRGRLIDFVSRFHGYNPGRGERAIDVAERPRRPARRRRAPRRRRGR